MNFKLKQTNNPLTFGLSMAGGLGIVLMILALGIGVVQGENADSGAIGTAFFVGLVLMVVGIGGWIAAVRPFDNFDDINQPIDTGHGHGSHDAHDAHDAHDSDAEHASEVLAPQLPATSGQESTEARAPHH